MLEVVSASCSSLALRYIGITGEYWAQRAILQETSGNEVVQGPLRGARGKDIRRDGFSLAEDRYCKCFPTVSSAS